jgi:26S proteasome regulatory subunit N13
MEVNWTQSTSSVGVLKIEWKDRRTRSVIDSLSIFPEDNCTYSKVDTGRPNDRVYYLQYGNASERRFFFWMQDKEEGNLDEDNCVKINTYMSDPEEAASVATGQPKKVKKRKEEEERKSQLKKSTTSGSGATATAVDQSGALDSDALMSIMQGLNATSEGSSNIGSGQVDALSNILQSLGMPQQSPSATSNTSSVVGGVTGSSSTPAPNNIAATPNAPAPKAAPSIGLTLSDLQGAMAGLATTSPPGATGALNNIGRPGPSLSEVVTPDAVMEAGILENNEVKERLIELLPENQRTEDRLLENLRSPQVRQCLQSLTAALCDDGSLDGFHSILANFQLRPEDGAVGLSQGNPIQAFLDCVLKSVQREKEEEEDTQKTEDQE